MSNRERWNQLARRAAASAANTKYEEFHNAVGTVPRGRAVMTMLYSSDAPKFNARKESSGALGIL